MFLFILEMRVDVTYEKIHSVKGGKTNYSLTPHPLVLNVPSPTEVMLYHCPWLKKKKKTTRKAEETQSYENPPTLLPGVQGASLSVGLLLLLHVQEDNAEDEEPEHHGEGAGVVGVGRGDEALVLRVLQWPHGHLRRQQCRALATRGRGAGAESAQSGGRQEGAYLSGGVQVRVA